jgi:hypothetical protein
MYFNTKDLDYMKSQKPERFKFDAKKVTEKPKSPTVLSQSLIKPIPTKKIQPTETKALKKIDKIVFN